MTNLYNRDLVKLDISHSTAVELSESSKNVAPKLFYRHGAGAARRAHNPEVTRSKRVAGILQNHINICCLYYLTYKIDINIYDECIYHR